ncbi:MAG: winged helix-turn-helix transcriptional regulator [Proteobacteria bacterium]|jgi:DNA-binding MarR family transcriptional regulator|nr:winged helix-turn-helix transcriptional regulator [Pseudomonadota bacterium]
MSRRRVDPARPASLLIGALLRVPAQAIQRRLIAGLNASGFPGLRLAHMAVLQYPGPDGCRPLELAHRAGMSKQAMNQLLKSLEQLGYLGREDAADDRRARRVYLTKRGHAVWNRMIDLLEEIEAEWRAALGAKPFAQLKELLAKVWSLDLSRATESAASPAPRRRRSLSAS